MSSRFMLIHALSGVSLGTALLMAPVPAAQASASQTASQNSPLRLTAVALKGNHRVSTEDILKAFGYQPGQTVTRADLNAAQQRIGALYSSRNVGTSLGEQLRITGNAVEVHLIFEEQAAPAQQPAAGLVLDQVTFAGNQKVSTAELQAATSLHAGSPVSNDTLLADEKAIQALYKSKNLGASIQPEATYPQHNNHVVLTWQIREVASKSE
ncbi:FtsQ-type POTRA domain-containing protein [Gluconobacter morbifer]|nr:FtsQ-type POTRA domain-containing protein [Gluconobacter morbifer]